MRHFTLIAIALFSATVFAHGGHEGDHEEQRRRPPANYTLPESEVKFEVRGDYRYVTANGLPDHKPGQFPNQGNPNGIRPQSYSYKMPAKPKQNRNLTKLGHSPFGIALNGVVFDPATAEFWNRDQNWNYEALTGGPTLGMDQNNAHVQPTGAYHYHGVPEPLITIKSSMKLIGYAADGFPIYGPYGYKDANDKDSGVKQLKSSYQLKKGERPSGFEGPGGKYDGLFTADWEYVKGSGDLDECNGRFGVTPEYPDGTYYYVITEEFPMIPRYFRGTPDQSFMRGGPRG